MIKMKRHLSPIIALACALSLPLAGCGGQPSPAPAADSGSASSSQSLVTGILQGSNIAVSLDTSGGLALVPQGVNFDVTKDGSVVARCYLMLKPDYDTHMSAAQSKDGFSQSKIAGRDTALYQNGDRWEALIAVPDTGLFVHVIDPVGQDSLNEVLSALSFKQAS